MTQITFSPNTKIQSADVNANFTELYSNALCYAEIISDFTTTTVGSAVDVTGLSVTVTVPSGGRRVKITAFAYGFYSETVANNTSFLIYENSTQLQSSRRDNSLAGATLPNPAISVYSSLATAGSHSYNVKIHQ